MLALLDPSELQGSSGAECKLALSTRVPSAQTSTHLESATALHRGAAASLLCSTSRSCMAAPLQSAHSAGAWSQRQASTLHPSAISTDEHAPRVRHRLAPWNSHKLALLDPSELHCGSGAECTHCMCLVSAAEALSTRVPSAQMSTHLESATALHRGAAASLLDQSELHGGS